MKQSQGMCCVFELSSLYIMGVKLEENRTELCYTKHTITEDTDLTEMQKVYKVLISKYLYH